MNVTKTDIKIYKFVLATFLNHRATSSIRLIIECDYVTK